MMHFYTTINAFVALGLLDGIRDADISDNTKRDIQILIYMSYQTNPKVLEGTTLNALNRLRLIEAKWFKENAYDLRDMKKIFGKRSFNMTDVYKIMDMNFDTKIPLKDGGYKCMNDE